MCVMATNGAGRMKQMESAAGKLLTMYTQGPSQLQTPFQAQTKRVIWGLVDLLMACR